MQRGVWGIPGHGVLNGIFDLIYECLDGQVGVVQCANFGVIALQVGGRNFRVGCVQMVQYGAGGGGAVSHVAVAEGKDEHFVNEGNEHFSKGLVGAIVLVEDYGGSFTGVAKVGDMGARRGRWDGGIGTGVNQINESCGQECCVHSGRDSELQ